MSFTLGSLTGPPPPLNLLVVGAAADGPLGEARYVSSVDLALRTYGGVTVGRLNPASGSWQFPASFDPDDETLRDVTVYHVPDGSAYGVAYPGLQNLAGSGYPVLATFDPVGSDPSVRPASGGVFIESTALYSPYEKARIPASGGFPSGGLLLPLCAALGEFGNPVGAYRVGSSWLPFGPPAITFPVPGGPTLTLRLTGQGDNGPNDRFTTPYLHLTGSALIADPGLLGLPYVRRTYRFSDYATWLALLSALNQDCLSGFLPFALDTVLSSQGLTSPPSAASGYLFPAYGDPGTTAPNLTAASGWAFVLSQEDLPTEDFGFLTLSGLTGEALAADPASAAAILEACGDSVLALPWSLDPPCATLTYDPTSDAALASSLRSYLGPDLGSKLLLVWGFAYCQGFPTYRGQQAQVPAAYAAAAGILREALTGTPMRPTLTSLSAQGPPYYIGPTLAEPPTGAKSRAVPGPAELDTLQAAGLMALTRRTGRAWTLHGPLETLDGSSLSEALAIAILRRSVEDSLDPYLGDPDLPSVEAELQGTLDSLSSDFLGTSAGSYLSSLDLTLQPTVTPGRLTITGSMSLYGETESVRFQIGIS